MNEEFGKRLAKLRIESGLTQRDLSREVGISHTQVSRYESGVASPRPAVLIRLATVLSTTLEYLRNGTTLEESLAAVDAVEGATLATEQIDLTADEYAQVLELSDTTGLSLPALVRQIVLTGLRAEFIRHRKELEETTNVDDLIASYDEKIARIGASSGPGKPKNTIK
jgi:transcriptional regulator with XRE-family HTH domain